MKGSEVAAETGAAVGGILLAKFLPAGIGAAIMIAVDPPRTRGELFARAFVAFACSYLFSDVAVSAIAAAPLIGSWFNPLNAGHVRAVDGLLGALGWFLAGGVSVIAKRFKRRPLHVVREIRDTTK